MPKTPTTNHSRTLRTILAMVALIAMLGASAACSSSSDGTADAKSDSADSTAVVTDANSDADAKSDAEADDSKSDSDDSSSSKELPDGFPDIPVPKFSTLDVEQDGVENGMDIWSVTFTVSDSGKSDAEIMDAYGAQLKEAGYEVTAKPDPATYGYKAAGHDLNIEFNASMGDLLIQIL